MPPIWLKISAPPQKIPRSGPENKTWIFPRFHHRDPKIRKKHKIKTFGSIEISSKRMKKFQKHEKSENVGLFMVFRGLSLPRFRKMRFFEKRYLRVTELARIRKIHEIL